MTRTRCGVTDFSAPTRSCASIRAAETFNVFASDKTNANVRQLNGRPGEVWGGESGNDRLVLIQTVYALPLRHLSRG